MRRIGWAILGAVLCSLSAFAGEVLVNDTGETATALRVVFSTPVIILGYGDVFTTVETTPTSHIFEFSGAALETEGIHWINWSPETTQLVEFEWTTKSTEPPPVALQVEDPGNVFAIAPPYGPEGFAVQVSDPAGDTNDVALPWCDILSAGLLLSPNGQLKLEMELRAGVPSNPGPDRYILFHWILEKAINPQADPLAFEQVLHFSLIHGDPGSWTASGWWGWRYTYAPFQSEPVEFNATRAFGQTVGVTTPNPKLKAGDTIRLTAWIEYQVRGSRIRTDQVPDEAE